MSHEAAVYEIDICIGAMPIRVRTASSEFAGLLNGHYREFAAPPNGVGPVCELDIELEALAGMPGMDADHDVSVRLGPGGWLMERGDFHATWDADLRRGCVRQTANPYAIDSVLRILHSLILAREGGFLVHAASAIRNGRAYLFAGVSGAGKTTISRLAPPDVTVLTDEISYVRAARSQGPRDERRETRNESSNRQSSAACLSSLVSHLSGSSLVTRHYLAYGTPFAGELARIGENTQAPLAALYLLAQGPDNRIEPVGEAEAGRALLRNILFFAHDAELMGQVFDSALEFVRHVPVRRLVFTPDESVWELIA